MSVAHINSPLRLTGKTSNFLVFHRILRRPARASNGPEDSRGPESPCEWDHQNHVWFFLSDVEEILLISTFFAHAALRAGRLGVQ